MFAVVDVETTGCRSSRDRIVEIAIVLFDGEKVQDSFSTLINPEIPIPYFITGLTGISNDAVAKAPYFYEVARKIVKWTENRILVAHNLRFDLSFLKMEFGQLGYSFRPKTLCTLRLSRQVFKGLSSYSLGALCSHFDIQIEDRHRALGDAQATCKLLGHIIKDSGGLESASDMLNRDIDAKLLPPKLEYRIVDKVSQSPGVYYLHDDNGRVIYVGKSKNMRTRILSHFQADRNSRKTLHFKNQIADISTYPTGSELVALLFESAEIKRLRPEFNRALRKARFRYGLNLESDKQGNYFFNIGTVEAHAQTLHLFGSRTSAINHLLALVDEATLCPKLACIDRVPVANFTHNESDCPMCRLQITSKMKNRKLLDLANRYQYPYSDFCIVERGRDADESAVILIEQSVYKGFGFAANDQDYKNLDLVRDVILPMRETPDVKRTILNYLRVKPRNTIPLPVSSPRQIGIPF